MVQSALFLRSVERAATEAENQRRAAVEEVHLHGSPRKKKHGHGPRIAILSLSNLAKVRRAFLSLSLSLCWVPPLGSWVTFPQLSQAHLSPRLTHLPRRRNHDHHIRRHHHHRHRRHHHRHHHHRLPTQYQGPRNAKVYAQKWDYDYIEAASAVQSATSALRRWDGDMLFLKVFAIMRFLPRYVKQ